MKRKRTLPTLLAILVTLSTVQPSLAQDSGLENALSTMYAACLFDPVGAANPFSQAVTLATGFLAPGISGFVESNLAAIPLTPPSLQIAEEDGELVNIVTGFTPIFTESVGTAGRGQFLVGSNFSFFDLSRIRGQNLSDIVFTFGQDSGGDVINVAMPLRIEASVITVYGTYGITNRLDVGFALPFVRLRFENEGTLFEVVGNQSGCNYSGGGCDFNEDGATAITVSLNDTSNPDVAVGFDLPSSDTYLSTLALRAKYRLSPSQNSGQVAAVVEVRIPTRSDDDILGSGNFGWRLTLIGEYDQLGTFKPYINLGAQTWNGDNSNSLRLATGFTQQVIRNKLFFAFDLLAKLDLESDPFLSSIDNSLSDVGAEIALLRSTIPSIDHEHTLNAGLGLQLAPSPSFHFYGSALFSLLDRGLQAPVTPTFGAAVHF